MNQVKIEKERGFRNCVSNQRTERSSSIEEFRVTILFLHHLVNGKYQLIDTSGAKRKVVSANHLTAVSPRSQTLDGLHFGTCHPSLR